MLIAGNNGNTVGSLTVSTGTGVLIDRDKWIRPGHSVPYYPTTDWENPVSNALAESVANVLMPCRIEKVIFHDPATIVIWKDKTKTVVKCHNEEFDREKGLAMCIAKKILGERFHQTFREWCGDDE